jgi:parallel beta-helix repeat protein
MKKKIGIFLLCIILLTSFQVVYFVKTVKAEETILYVGGNGSGNYSTIQAAIDDSKSGDTIFIYSGLYNENISINKSKITLKGENKNTTIIDGKQHWYTIKIENNIDKRINKVNIFDITVQNASYYGIYIRFSDEINILNSIIQNNSYCGIYIEYSDYSIYEFNKIINNTWWDFYIELSAFCKIRYNHIKYGRTGIRTESCNNNEYAYNEIKGHYHYGIQLARHAYITKPNLIHHNNFIDNNVSARFQDCTNIWYKNYWNKSKLIHIIPGSRYLIFKNLKTIKIPIYEFDFFPAKNPYKI